MMDDDKDLPNSGPLKRTGRVGELMTDERRKREIEQNKKELESLKNSRSGILNKYVHTDRMLSTPTQRKDFKKEESDKIERKNNAKTRLKELETRR